MIDRFRAWLTTSQGQIATMIVAGVALLLGGRSVLSAFRGSDAAVGSQSVMFVCKETGKSFSHTVSVDEAIPIDSPYSGNKSGFPADEVCTWKEDGTPGTAETYVLLEEKHGGTGPTFCPTCHRLVVRNNPPALPGQRVPPTEAEWKAKHSKSPGGKPAVAK